MRRAYDVDPLLARGLDGKGTTIALVVFFGSPTIRDDLARFDQAFAIPAPPNLSIVASVGRIPAFNASNQRMVAWASETSLDVEWAHAMAPGANLLVVEVPLYSGENGLQSAWSTSVAEKYVMNRHLAQVICQTFTEGEASFPAAAISETRGDYVAAEEHKVTVIGISGDTGPTAYTSPNKERVYERQVANYPGSDPLVTTVGGTDLTLDTQGNAGTGLRLERFLSLVGGYRYSERRGWRPVDRVRATDVPRRRELDRRHASRCPGDLDECLRRCAGAGLSGLPGVEVRMVPGRRNQRSRPPFRRGRCNCRPSGRTSIGFPQPGAVPIDRPACTGIVDITSGTNTVAFTQDGKSHRVQGWDATAGYDLASGLGTIDAAKLVTELAATSRP